MEFFLQEEAWMQDAIWNTTQDITIISRIGNRFYIQYQYDARYEDSIVRATLRKFNSKPRAQTYIRRNRIFNSPYFLRPHYHIHSLNIDDGFYVYFEQAGKDFRFWLQQALFQWIDDIGELYNILKNIVMCLRYLLHGHGRCHGALLTGICVNERNIAYLWGVADIPDNWRGEVEALDIIVTTILARAPVVFSRLELFQTFIGIILNKSSVEKEDYMWLLHHPLFMDLREKRNFYSNIHCVSWYYPTICKDDYFRSGYSNSQLSQFQVDHTLTVLPNPLRDRIEDVVKETKEPTWNKNLAKLCRIPHNYIKHCNEFYQSQPQEPDISLKDLDLLVPTILEDLYLCSFYGFRDGKYAKTTEYKFLLTDLGG